MSSDGQKSQSSPGKQQNLENQDPQNRDPENFNAHVKVRESSFNQIESASQPDEVSTPNIGRPAMDQTLMQLFHKTILSHPRIMRWGYFDLWINTLKSDHIWIIAQYVANSQNCD